MASFVSGQNEPNPAIVIGYLNRQDGSILPSLDYPLCPRRKISPKFIYPLLTKLVWSRWLDIGEFMDL